MSDFIHLHEKSHATIGLVDNEDDDCLSDYERVLLRVRHRHMMDKTNGC